MSRNAKKVCEIEPYYFIFKESCLHNTYFLKIYGDNQHHARRMMTEKYGDSWSSCFIQKIHT